MSVPSTVAWALARAMTHETKRSPEASVSFLFCLQLRFRPEGPISESPGRSPGSGAPPKRWFPGLKGRFQGVCCCCGHARRFQVLTHLALLKPVLQALGCVGLTGSLAPSLIAELTILSVFCRPLRFTPEGPISDRPGTQPWSRPPVIPVSEARRAVFKTTPVTRSCTGCRCGSRGIPPLFHGLLGSV